MDTKPPQTPIDVLERNVAAATTASPTKKKLAALVTTGSLNPVHIGHVRQLELAAEALESKKGYTVVAAWLSPSDAQWSGGKPHGCIGNEHKLAMAQFAVEDHPLVRCSRWEIDNGMIDYPAVWAHVRKVCGADVEVFYVCGSDHARKCRLLSRPNCVVIGRPGSEIKDVVLECVYVPVAPGAQDISSTAIRMAAEQNTLHTVKDMMHPKVFKYLSNHRNEIWGE